VLNWYLLVAYTGEHIRFTPFKNRHSNPMSLAPPKLQNMPNPRNTHNAPILLPELLQPQSRC